MAQGKLLEGIRVLDFTQYIASALATRILSDMGAEVIHVERYPHGDLSRVSGLLTLEDGVSAMFLSNNVGKKSLCVDLKSPEGVDLIKRLIPHFDLLAEGYTPGQMAKYGLAMRRYAPSSPTSSICPCRASGRRAPCGTG